ncbi:MAG: hypothetical protein WA581_11385 [Candidatus Acidiferrales bacterium]
MGNTPPDHLEDRKDRNLDAHPYCARRHQQAGKRSDWSALNRVRSVELSERRLPRQCAGNSLRRFGRRHEQSERAVRKRRESKVAIEGRCLFIRRFDHNGENRKRPGRSNYPPNRIGKQKIADAFASHFLITRETPNESSRNGIIAGQAFCMFGRQIGNGEREGTQAVETDDPVLIVDGDKDTRHIAPLVLASAKTEPIIECNHTARKRRAVMLAERFHRFDHARSAEEMTMTLQSLDKTRGWIRVPANRREEGVAIRARQNHALMLVENPARTLIRNIAGSKSGDRHGLLDYFLC